MKNLDETALFSNRSDQLHQLVLDFLNERLKAKLDKLADDDPKRQELIEQHRPENWLPAAARRAGQIQAVTHTLKAVHPDAKGTNCHAPPAGLAKLSVVGSHCLGDAYELDVVGNAAALDVYKFLRLTHSGQSLLDLAQQADADLAAALSDDVEQAQAWMAAFAGLLEPKGAPSSHTLAKQVYWPVSSAVHEDAGFHLLQPLFASSLAHAVYTQVQEDRFGESAKQAREAKKAGAHCIHPARYYPDMAVQQMGGTKPQNISQLNSQRRGNNHLFASLPPQWKNQQRPLLKATSLFDSYGRRQGVRKVVQGLIAFLQTDPDPIQETRDKVDADLMRLVDELLAFTLELRELPEGWSQHKDCALGPQQKHWLDPVGAQGADEAAGAPWPTDILEVVSEGFANWLRQRMRQNATGALPVGDIEFREWRKRVFDELKPFDEAQRTQHERMNPAGSPFNKQEATHV